ncbi:hypothetical protein FEU67_14635, partial [Listeria monocytogenes]|nr:hypothetical protein [Listeria monocytogenes]
MRILLFKERDKIPPNDFKKELLGDENIIRKLKLANVLFHKVPVLNFDEELEDAELDTRDEY